MNDQFLTTGKIAKYCHVTNRAVQQWITSGKLPVTRTPGRHSRVRREDFISFLKNYQMSVPQEFQSEGGSPKVLVVEDDKTTVKLLTRLLAREGYQVEVAHNGFEAGIKFAAFAPDLISLDLQMPHLNGYEVLKMIRADMNNKEVGILVVSAFLDEEAIAKVKALGADDYLRKPIDQGELKAKVQALMERRLAIGLKR